VALVLVVGCVRAGDAAAPPPAAASAEQIARWVRELDDDRFDVREAAHRNLRRAGQRALPALASAAASDSLEVATRAFRILRELLSSADEATGAEIRAVLLRLAASTDPRVAARARAVLALHHGRIAAQLEKGGALVVYKDDRIVRVTLDAVPRLAPLLPLLHELPDLEYLSASNKQMDDAALGQLKGLRKLEYLNLYQSGIGDEGLIHLKSLPALRHVPMGETKVTDAGLKHLADLTQLEYVGLRANRVTDAGLVHLRKLTNLTGLHLGETRVTDAGLTHLEGLTSLRQLSAWQTGVTPAGVARLRKVLPKLEVTLQGP
jgi:hypothetical protein